MVELPCGLVVLRGPILAAVDGNGCAAVIAVDDAIGIVGIDPETMMVAVGRIEAFECLATAVRTEQASVDDLDVIQIRGAGPNVCQVEGAHAATQIYVAQLPV